ncbi:hypothetical protein I8540_002777, partial [Clostridium perfringens]|nr:hypothetical protein [Clostridium perfringens]
MFIKKIYQNITKNKRIKPFVWIIGDGCTNIVTIHFSSPVDGKTVKIKMRLFEKINNYILEEYEKRLIKIINIFLYFK